MKKILLVNASRYFFDDGKSLLDRKDFHVFMAPSAMRALQIHRDERVNLIVADIDLQDIPGDALCVKIREDGDSRAVSFILICHDNPDELARGADCGANVCIRKPFSAQKVLDHVEKLLAISVRRGYRVLLRAKVKGAQDDAVFFCTSQNISVSGILIETDRPLAVGEQLICSFFLSGSARIKAEGEVARVVAEPDGKYHCGIRFTAIDEEFRKAIETFITESMLSIH